MIRVRGSLEAFRALLAGDTVVTIPVQEPQEEGRGVPAAMPARIREARHAG